jgi:hypothetical protein
MKLPKTLRDKRDEDLEQYLSSEFTYDDTMKKVYLRGYDQCFSDISEAVQELLKACSLFKKGFDRGFPNSLNTIEARDAIFDALARYREFLGERE